jgi:hypothetical protein
MQTLGVFMLLISETWHNLSVDVYNSDVFAPTNRREVTEKVSEIALQVQKWFSIEPATLFIRSERNT